MHKTPAELRKKLPLARATLELLRYTLSAEVTASIFERYRGRCYEDELTFDQCLDLLRTALLEHGGSAHRAMMEMEREEQLAAHKSSYYRKLANTPVQVSRALLRDGTARLRNLIAPQAVELPACFDALQVVVIDGKRIRNAAKRLIGTRGVSGKLLGAKALVAMDLRRGLALAMSDSLDGQTNDIPLVPILMPQVHQVVEAPTLFMADRQFSDLTTMGLLTQREGDHFVVRIRRGLNFAVETTQIRQDDQGRPVTDELGVMGKGAHARKLRRVTLSRDGGDDVVVLTDLLDSQLFPALDLLSLYRHRWGIEQMFQQVTETFNLSHLIGCSPRGILLQFSFCLLMYNLVQVVKAQMAQEGSVRVAEVSTHGLFYDMKRELMIWSYLDLGAMVFELRDESSMRRYLVDQLRGLWDAVAYLKKSDKKPRTRAPVKRLRGGHTSVQRLLDEAAKKQSPRAAK